MTAHDAGERDARPSPDALLAAIQDERRGRLKIFLGAAPGVGKTYEMLLNGRARRGEGIDVVIGVVETHGRQETQALVDGFEIVPRRRVEYRGRMVEEMDLDAVLARRPQLVLVDELAHTNAPGSRHPKRHLDVEELLAAGIDVYTTLNIQHLESLNDVVAQITRIRVRETLPDGVLDRADEIEVVDLTPEALIQRLREGKVYVRDQAQRALKHYFSPGNLTALRELALRRTAQRVDEQMLSYMQLHAIEGPWAAGDRLMVCISESPNVMALVRHARLAADRLRCRWLALYVETERWHRLSEEQRDRVAEALRLAEKLGGQAVTLPGRNIVDTMLDYAQRNNITQIVIGKSERPRWFEVLHGSVVHELVRRAGTISVRVMAGEPEGQPPAGSKPNRPPPRQAKQQTDLKPYVVSTLLVALAGGVAEGLVNILTLPNISLVFLMAVLASAVRFGLGPSLYASVLAALAYNFFFLPPLYTFTIADPANLLALATFAVTAVLTSNLAARTRLQARTAAARARTTADLYGFSRKLAGIGNLDDLLWATVHQIALMLKVRVVLLLPEGESLAVRAGYPPEDALDDADLAAALWCRTRNQPTGRGSDTLPGARRLFLPLRTGRGVIGVIGIDRDQAGPLLTPDEARLLDALADQAAVAIDRTQLATDIEEARVRAETERLRAAMLTSISHDLRTPLASIIGSASSLRSYGDLYGAADRDGLLATIQDEAERLNRFVANLLDMIRLESGAITLKREPADLAEIVATARRRLSRVLAHHHVVIDIAGDLPMVSLDLVLFEQVLVNLLDNAAKYAPADTAISIAARLAGERLTVTVADQGPGIAPAERQRVFDPFYRIQAADRQRAGTGLGLAICRGFIEAMGGRIDVGEGPSGTGAVFTIILPAQPVATLPAPPVAPPAEGTAP